MTVASVNILGAVLAGGTARRFGSDKALAETGDGRLIDLAARALRPHVAALVVCGREHDGLVALADRPRPALGPLGGLCAALHHARAEGHDAVLTIACDMPAVPAALLVMLARDGGPAVIAGQPLLGCWPADLADRLDAHLGDDSDRSMRGWAAAVGARVIATDRPITNINSRDDLAHYLRTTETRPLIRP